jgi:uncharacterized RDD family membrane protein YckC
MSDPTQNPPPEGTPPTGQTPPGAWSTGPGQPAPPPPPPPGTPYGEQPGYGYGPATSGVGQPADVWIRFLARLIDGILVGIVNAIISAVLIVGLLGASSATGYGLSTGNGFAIGALSAIITTALYLGYFVVMESQRGQTVGKMLLKLETQGPEGGHPTVEQAFKRNVWTGLGILGIIPLLGFVGSLLELAAAITIAVTISSSPVKEGWHDRFAGGTKVLKIG